MTAGSGRQLRRVDGDGRGGGMWCASTSVSRSGLSATRVVWRDLERRVDGRELRRGSTEGSAVTSGDSMSPSAGGSRDVARIASFDLLRAHLGEHGAKSLAQLVHALARVDAEGSPLVRVEVLQRVGEVISKPMQLELQSHSLEVAAGTTFAGRDGGRRARP